MPGAAREIEKAGVSRRTVVVGIAWATPAVMGLSATPAFAASEPDDGKAVLKLTAHASIVRSSGTPSGVEVLITVTNTLKFPEATVSTLLVTVAVPAAYFADEGNAQITTVSETSPKGLGEWSDQLEPPAPSGDTLIYTLQFFGALPSVTPSSTSDLLLWIPSASIPDSALPIAVQVLASSDEASNAPSAILHAS